MHSGRDKGSPRTPAWQALLSSLSKWPVALNAFHPTTVFPASRRHHHCSHCISIGDSQSPRAGLGLPTCLCLLQLGSWWRGTSWVSWCWLQEMQFSSQDSLCSVVTVPGEALKSRKREICPCPTAGLLPLFVVPALETHLETDRVLTLP